ncbi:DUF2279 domain-containing protein [soil metagenome]
MIKEAIKSLLKRIDSPGKRIKNVLIFSFGVYTFLMLALGYAWYSKQWGNSFHFFDDAAEWKQMDKLAHFLWSFHVSVAATRLLSWAQADERKSILFGTAMGFLFVSSIEIFDGFSQSYGASLYDILANAAGCSAFIAQRIFFKRIMVWPKFSFHPTAFAPLRPNMLGDGFLEEVLKDYNGQTFWYSVNFKILSLPSWLTVAVGIGAEGMVYSRDAENELINLSPYRKYFLSLDLNLSNIKTNSKSLGYAVRILNIIKVPAPAIEFSSEGIKFHPIYF